MEWYKIYIDIGLVGCAVWYLKHLIKTSSKQQLEEYKQSESANNRKLLELLKSDLSWSSELRKIRFSSIYERRINSLLDIFSSVQKYEISIGEISRNATYKDGSNFDKLYKIYVKYRSELIEVFWCNSALFNIGVIEEFKKYRKNMESYDLAYDTIYSAPNTGERSFDGLDELEYHQSEFSRSLKDEIKDAIENS